jgi:hypothetical protein
MAIKIYLFAGLLFIASCAGTTKKDTAKEAEPVISFIDQKPAEGLDTIAIFTPATTSTYELWSALKAELVEEFNTSTMLMTPDVTVETIASHMKKENPVAVVLMDNSTVKKYVEYQKNNPADNTPVFIFMSSFLGELIKAVKNANGIAYEVPGILSFVRLRNILNIKMEKIGVVHRQAFTNFIAKEKKMAAVEEIDLIGISVSNKPTESELKEAITKLKKTYEVDAIWILNDNTLLTGELLGNVWMPVVDTFEIPVVVNIMALLNKDLKFGILAVTPDNKALGMQAASMIFNVYDNDWEIETGTVELPVSVETSIDEKGAQSKFGLKENATDFIDKKIE